MSLRIHALTRALILTPALLTALLSPTAQAAKEPGGILVVGHRGASGYRPEHTLAAYELAIEQGADFIEPDLVMSKDGVLIARHENEISGTTDAATKFPDRKRAKTIDGAEVTGWFTEDFTLAELKTLRAKERLDSRDHSHDFRYEIPTIDEVLELAVRRSRETGRAIGVYPETKHPAYFESIGLALEPALARALEKHGMSRGDAPAFVQSFELESLKKMKKLSPVRRILLLSDSSLDMTTPRALAELKRTVDGIGPDKRLIVPQDSAGRLGQPTSLVRDAHAAGLKVHAYTFRSDKEFLHADYGGDPLKEYMQFYRLGVDGLFTDFPDHAVRARDLFASACGHENSRKLKSRNAKNGNEKSKGDKR